MSNYPPGVNDDDPHFTDNTEPEEPTCPSCGYSESEHLSTDAGGDKDWRCPDPEVAYIVGEPWPRDAEEAAMCTPITLWNRTLDVSFAQQMDFRI